MNFLKIAVAILLFLIITAVTVKIHPGIHSPMIIEDADFEIVEYVEKEQPVTIVSIEETQKPQEIITKTQAPKSEQKVTFENQKPASKTVQTKPQSKKVEVKTATNPTDKSQSELLQKVLKNAQKVEVQPQEALKPKQSEAKQEQSKPKTVTKPVETQQSKVTVQPVKTGSNPYMTEEEEIIAWNVWRSNIHNQIMKDSNIGYSPIGTVYKFSFIVDKFGNVSNIKVDVTPSQYIDIARNGVKPAISRLQNKPILNFPMGTRRTSTVVEGKFAVGTTNRYSTPKEYSDYERVTH